MRKYLLIFLVGMICLPFVWDFNRAGALISSTAIIVLCAFIGFVASSYFGEIKFWKAALSFLSGAALIEVVYYANWYMNYEYHETDRGLGLAVSVLESVYISFTGIAAIGLMCIVKKHITSA